MTNNWRPWKINIITFSVIPSFCHLIWSHLDQTNIWTKKKCHSHSLDSISIWKYRLIYKNTNLLIFIIHLFWWGHIFHHTFHICVTCFVLSIHRRHRLGSVAKNTAMQDIIDANNRRRRRRSWRWWPTRTDQCITNGAIYVKPSSSSSSSAHHQWSKVKGKIEANICSSSTNSIHLVQSLSIPKSKRYSCERLKWEWEREKMS